LASAGPKELPELSLATSASTLGLCVVLLVVELALSSGREIAYIARPATKTMRLIKIIVGRFFFIVIV
jgi:hypothetical protein